MSAFSKFLLYSSIVLILGAVSLWFVGGKKTDYEARTTIAAPPERIFALLIEPEGRKKWLNGVEDVVLLSDPPIDIKARYETTFVLDGEKSTTTDEVMQFERDEWVSIRSNNGSVISTAKFNLTKSNDQTVLTYLLTEQPAGFSRMLAPFRQSNSGTRLEDELTRIKQQAEQNGPAPN